MIFRQLYDPQSSTYSYILGDETTREAIIIDPVFEQVRREVALLQELDLKLVATLDTHVHADHVTGAWLLKERTGAKIALSAKSGAKGADIHLKQGDRVAFGKRFVEARETPGHTNGCMTFVLDDQSAAFTGDALLIRGCGRTDFQQGNASSLFHSIHQQIFSLPDNCTVYPGHDYAGSTSSSVGEERRYNPRLGKGIREEDFRGFMDNLGLPHPKQMDIAVPANLQCGRPPEPLPSEAAWGPVHTTFAGVPEIAPQWVEENLGNVHLIDVREPQEFNDALGHAPGAVLIPLGQLPQRFQEIPKDKPVAVICRSGARSARATLFLRQNGFDRVANVSGGMLRWRTQNLKVE
jgi:glyoxylase-like metal-dependent hydrolase (beta-lactamase superfamily II)/rhodanese-related sulfurtransferase